MTAHRKFQRVRRGFAAVLIGVVAAFLTCAGKSSAADLSHRSLFRLVDGRTFQGRVQKIDSAWKVTAENDAGETLTIALDELTIWGRMREPNGPQTLLIDDSVVAGDIVRYGAKSLTAGIDYESFSQRSIWEPTPIDLDRVRGVVFQQPGDLSERDRLYQWFRSDQAKADRVRLTNGDELAGAVLRIGFPETAQDDADPDAEPDRMLFFKTGGRETAAALSRVRAIALNPALSREPPANRRGVLLGFRDGSAVLRAKPASRRAARVRDHRRRRRAEDGQAPDD